MQWRGLSRRSLRKRHKLVHRSQVILHVKLLVYIGDLESLPQPYLINEKEIVSLNICSLPQTLWVEEKYKYLHTNNMPG